MRWLAERPLLVKALTSVALCGIGDLIGQLGIEGRSLGDLDLRRLASMGAIGGVLVGPTLHVWYGALFRWMPATTTGTALGRMALDQFVFAPCFVVVFFAGLKLLEGRLDLLPDLVRSEWWTTTKTNWALWIPAQFINFRFVPLPLQVLYANFVALIWNTFLSWATHQREHAELEAGKQQLQAAAAASEQ